MGIRLAFSSALLSIGTCYWEAASRWGRILGDVLPPPQVRVPWGPPETVKPTRVDVDILYREVQPPMLRTIVHLVCTMIAATLFTIVF